jgi:DDE domain
VEAKGRWTYRDRAVDSHGQTIDFLLPAKRDAEAAKRFVRKGAHTVQPAYHYRAQEHGLSASGYREPLVPAPAE